MVTLSLPLPSRVASRLKQFGRLIIEVAEAVQEARHIATRYEALSRMSDAQLAKRGLKREDITLAAVTGAKDI